MCLTSSSRGARAVCGRCMRGLLQGRPTPAFTCCHGHPLFAAVRATSGAGRAGRLGAAPAAARARGGGARRRHARQRSRSWRCGWWLLQPAGGWILPSSHHRPAAASHGHNHNSGRHGHGRCAVWQSLVALMLWAKAPPAQPLLGPAWEHPSPHAFRAQRGGSPEGAPRTHLRPAFPFFMARIHHLLAGCTCALVQGGSLRMRLCTSSMFE